jgi:hypothetical protein
MAEDGSNAHEKKAFALLLPMNPIIERSYNPAGLRNVIPDGEFVPARVPWA